MLGRSFRCAVATAPSRGLATAAAKRVVVVDGVRLPFQRSNGAYEDEMAYDLGRDAIKGLLTKTALDPKSIDYLLMGTVIQEVRTSNLARECALGAGVPNTVASHTVTQACISANQAICTGAEKILAGRADIVVAGGAETFSDVPIRFSRPMRKKLLAANKVMRKGPAAVAKVVLDGLKPGHLAPEAPAIANFATGEVMGHNSDRLAARFGVSRSDQDEFAVRSHLNAAAAHADGFYDDEIVAHGGSTEERGIQTDASIESFSAKKPAFIKPHGTHTAANSSFLTDGAAACLLMSEEKALALGYAPRAVLKEWTFVAVDPFEDLLLGPAYAAAKVLGDAGLSMSDLDVVELHEAFAGQVLANIAAMGSDQFGREQLGLQGKLGDVPMEKLNTRGGSLSIGHPFGATGARLTTTAANRLHAEDGRFALIAACADSGLGHACLLERYEQQ